MRQGCDKQDVKERKKERKITTVATLAMNHVRIPCSCLFRW